MCVRVCVRSSVQQCKAFAALSTLMNLTYSNLSDIVCFAFQLWNFFWLKRRDMLWFDCFNSQARANNVQRHRARCSGLVFQHSSPNLQVVRVAKLPDTGVTATAFADMTCPTWTKKEQRKKATTGLQIYLHSSFIHHVDLVRSQSQSFP